MRRFVWLLLIALSETVVAQTPVAHPDTVRVTAGQSTMISLVANDEVATRDSVVVEVLLPPSHGSLTSSGGALTYQPDPGFSGLDSLRYRLQRVPLSHLRVDSSRSELTLRANLAIPQIGSDDDEVDLRIAGSMSVHGVPASPPFDSVGVAGLALSNADSTGLEFNYGDLGVTVLTVSLAAQSGGIQLSMLEPGPAVATGFAGLFTQVGNELGVRGEVGIEGSGILGSGVPTGTEEFDTSTTTDIAGLAGPGPEGVQAILTIDIAQTVDISGNTADLVITGEVIANGPAGEAGNSNETTVLFEVVSGLASDDVPELHDLSVYPNPVAGVLYVDLPPGGWRTVEVVDVLGRIVSATEARGATSLDLSRFPTGVYWVIARGTGHAPSVARVVLVR